ncbi:MAG: hypothetical protein M3Y82_07710 [Verrucomicrobiota bacterium]|nr:hypothetical protein [Verrucomicrobiota bacterium]
MNFRGRENNLLFFEGDLSATLQAYVMNLRAEIDGFASDYVLKVSFDDLTKHLADKFQIEPISLLKDNIHIGESGDTSVDMSHNFSYGGGATHVPATFAEFVIPFTGDPVIFRLKPSTYNFNPPRATVIGHELHLRYTSVEHNPLAMRSDFDNDLKNIEQFLQWGEAEIQSYNRRLEETIRQQLNHRKEKFLKDRGLVEALGFPIKTRASSSQTYAAPVTRKKLPIQKPAVTAGTFKPEPRLEMEHYEHILTVVCNMVPVMERSPQAFAQMGEEDLRTHILVQLNGHYEGQATGETFNYEGKTDILIRAEGRNIFIGECKIWKGAENLKTTVDQLLGYTAWRDTKTAIILFNRNKNTSAVVAQIPELMKRHANFKCEVAGYKQESGFRFILHHRDDKNHELTLTVLVFDVPM